MSFLRRYFGKISFLPIGNLVGNNGELVIDEGTDKIYIMDGITPGGHEIANVDALAGNISGDILPWTNVSYNIGNTTNQWNNVHIGNLLYLNGAPLNVSGGNLYVNGTLIGSGGGGGGYNQDLNTYNSPTFAGLTLNGNIISDKWINPNADDNNWGNLRINANKVNANRLYAQERIDTEAVYANNFIEYNPTDYSGFTFQGYSGTTGLLHANIGNVTTLGLYANGVSSWTNFANGFNNVAGYTQFLQNVFISGSNLTVPNNTTIGLLPTFNPANAKFTYVDNVDTYSQMMIQNKNSGSTASGDIVITADNGTDSTNYIDLGINSSTFNDGGIDKPNDGYLIMANGNLFVATLSTNKDIIFGIGGHALTSEVARFKSHELNVTGNIIPAANVTYSLGNVNYQWKDLYVSNNTIYINNIPLSIAANSALLVNNNPVATTVNGTLTNSGDIYATGNVTANDTLRAVYGDIGNVQLYGGVVFLKPDAVQDYLVLTNQIEGWAYLELPRDVIANVSNVRLHNDAGNIQISTGDFSTGSTSYNWYFKNDGSILLPPVGSGPTFPSTGVLTDTQWVAPPGGEVDLASNNGNNYVWVDNYASYIGTNWNVLPRTWEFGTNGIITTPNGGLIGNVDSNDPNSFGLKAGGSVNYVELNYGNDQRIYVDSASVNIGTNNNVSQYLWSFSDDGSTTFPDHKPVSITGNLTVGNLFVTGNSTVINTNSYTVSDNIIQLANSNPADILDLGFVAHRTVTGTLQHTGLIRDASANIWRLFSNVTSQPGATVDFTNAVYDALQIGNVTSTGNVAAEYFLGYFQGLIGSITNLDSTNFSTQNIYAIDPDTGVNIGAGGNNNLLVKPNEVKIQNVPLIANTVTANLGNVITTSGVFWSNGVSALTSSYGNTEVAAYLPTATSITANLGNVITSGGVFWSNGVSALTSSYGNTQVASYLTGNVTIGNIAMGVMRINGSDQTLTTQNGSAIIVGTRLNITGSAAGVGLSVTSGNISAGSATATLGNVITTNGIYWSNGVAYSTGGGSSYSNSDVAGYLIGNITIGNLVSNGGGQIRGYHTGAIGANIANTGAFTTISATGNITATTANVYAANIIGNTAVIGAAFKYSNGAAYDGTYSNSNVSSYLPTYTGNVGAGNLIGTSSNVTITSGSNVWTFDNTGNLSLPNLSATYILGANTNGNININTVGTGAVNVTGNLTISGINAGYAPNRPAFRVYGSNSYQWQGGNTIVAGSVDYNQGSYYNAITGIFTAPIAGLYHAYATLRVGTNNGMNQASIQKNSSNSGANVISFWETDTNTGTATHFSMTGYARCVAGDTIRLQSITGNINLDANDSWGVTYIG